jgi:methylmalonyl-CoA mutase cobalamin-binding domain/chain
MPDAFSIPQRKASQLAFGVGMPRRILIAKPGLDGHDRGAKVIARALRDAGNEVIYSGLHQTPAQIAETALQEDVDAVGLSSLSGAHKTLFPQVVEQLKARDSSNVIVFGGGVIPDADQSMLKSAGIVMIFTPGTTLDEITDWVESNIPLRD